MRKYCCLLLLIWIYLLPFPLAGEPPAPSAANSAPPGGVPSLIIFDFFPVQEDFPAKYNYLADTIPDIIREQLLADNAFYLVEKQKLQETAPATGNTGDKWHRSGDLRLAAARILESDYYIWGYFIIEEERLLIFFQLVETSSARTIHIDKGEFPIGFELFDEVDRAATAFSGWINKTLPERFRYSRDTPAETPAPVPVQTPEPSPVILPPATPQPDTNLSLAVSGQYHFFLPPFTRYLEPNPGLRLDFSIQNRELTPFYYGLSLLLTLLSQPAIGDTPVAGNIKILFLPILVRTGLDIDLLSCITLEAAVNLGGALFFGYLAPEMVAYFRFTAGPEILLTWHASPFLDISIGLGCLFTPYSYSNWLMINLYPELLLTFSL